MNVGLVGVLIMSVSEYWLLPTLLIALTLYSKSFPSEKNDDVVWLFDN